MAGVVVYSSARATLYLGKAEDVLPTLERGSADLVIADPPYGQAWRSGLRTKAFDVLSGDAAPFALGEHLANLCRALKPFRHLYLFGPGDLGEAPLTGRAELIWDKAHIGPGDLSQPWGPAHERITFAVHIPSAGNRAAGRGKLAARLRHGSVLRVPRLCATAVKRHPTEKPVALLRQLVESSSSPDDVVLDPFAGVASAGVAAVLSGRRYVGVELDERYATIGAARLAQAEELYDLAAKV